MMCMCIATPKEIDKCFRDGVDDPFPYFPGFLEPVPALFKLDVVEQC